METNNTEKILEDYKLLEKTIDWFLTNTEPLVKERELSDYFRSIFNLFVSLSYVSQYENEKFSKLCEELDDTMTVISDYDGGDDYMDSTVDEESEIDRYNEDHRSYLYFIRIELKLIYQNLMILECAGKEKYESFPELIKNSEWGKQQKSCIDTIHQVIDALKTCTEDFEPYIAEEHEKLARVHSNPIKDQAHKSYPVMTIIGYSKYKAEIEEAKRDFIKQGYIVLDIGIYPLSGDKLPEGLTEAHLIDMQKSMVDRCKKIYVVNKNDFIDSKTLDVLNYAREREKDIEYMVEHRL